LSTALSSEHFHKFGHHFIDMLGQFETAGSISNYDMFRHFSGMYNGRKDRICSAIETALHLEGERTTRNATRMLDVGAFDGELTANLIQQLNKFSVIRELVVVEPDSRAMSDLQMRTYAGVDIVTVIENTIEGFLAHSLETRMTFDIISTIHSAYHFERLAPTFFQMRELLSSGGVLVCVVDSSKGEFYEFAKRCCGDNSRETRTSLYGGHVLSDDVCQSLGSNWNLFDYEQHLAFRDEMDVMFALSFVARRSLKYLMRRAPLIISTFERMFGPLPLVVNWPEVCVVAGTI
jgi:SAM-dependent methyltransferase